MVGPELFLKRVVPSQRIAFEVIDRNVAKFATLLSISLDAYQHEVALRGYSESLILAA